MKKLSVLLLVIFSLFTTFVAAQDTAAKPNQEVADTTRKDIVIEATHITLIKGDNTLPKDGHFTITFSKYPRIVYFADLDEHSIMRIKLGELIKTSHIQVVDENGKMIDATGLTFDAEANGKFSILFTTIFLDSDKSVYAIAISLGDFTLSVRFQDGTTQLKPTN